MFDSFLGKFKALAKSPMTIFVYGILSKWVITVTVAAIMVTYWVFKGLSEAGILQAAEDVVFKALNETKAVAQHCVPQIMHFGDFWDCLQSPPDYTPSKEEETLHESVQKIVDPTNSTQRTNPYDK